MNLHFKLIGMNVLQRICYCRDMTAVRRASSIVSEYTVYLCVFSATRHLISTQFIHNSESLLFTNALAQCV